MPPTLEEHLDPKKSPKRILALDGGGTLGIIEIAFLEKIEHILRRRNGNDPDFRLCHYFDLIGGTSTGAIVAAALALGKSATEVKDLYMSLAKEVFKQTYLGSMLSKYGYDYISPPFDAKNLTNILRNILGDRELQSPDLETGLGLVTKRIDTGSVWVLTNNPRSKFFEDPPVDPKNGTRPYIGNKHYKLCDIVRASAAVPFYFAPQKVRIEDAKPHGLFVDGGVSPLNNPALQLLMLAGMGAYGFNWPIDKDKLLLISIGSGWRRPEISYEEAASMLSAKRAVIALRGVCLWDCGAQTLMLLQWLSEPTSAWPINSEVHDLSGDILGGGTHDRRELLTFQRYDVDFDPSWIEKRAGKRFGQSELKRLHNFVEPAVMPDVYSIASKVAEKEVDERHFPAAFDIQPLRAASQASV